jgi:cellulose synthase/poly-beta-1,6-N-acetylglucosamine synthase-like glycosyltransferase
VVPNLGDLALAGGSLLLAAQSGYSAATSLYAWEDESRHAGSRAPEDFEAPTTTFTILLPARHEEEVIGDTIERMVELDYPPALVQVLVVIEAGDRGTIDTVEAKLDQLAARGIERVRLITFDDPPINKPHGLNVGLGEATGEVVTIFDAEDEPHPDILNVVNTILLRERSAVVQCGVQLMNYDQHWFSALNVIEYFFWFKSRLHYHGTRGAVPLGGNTVFVRRDLLAALGGWDDRCLTEDADLGIRLSAAGVPIRLVYEDDHVTREETPHSVGDLVRQRTRWDQGFLQVLGKGDWRRLRTRAQRLLAFYTLVFPIFQAVMMLYLPVAFYLMVAVRVPVLVAMAAALPFYMLGVQFLIGFVGLNEFIAAHGLKRRRLAWLKMAVAFFPYQWLLSYAALRAVWRQMRRVNSWEKTTHTGAHRSQLAEMAQLEVGH